MIKQITVAERDICGRTEKARPETFRNETDYKLPDGWMMSEAAFRTGIAANADI